MHFFLCAIYTLLLKASCRDQKRSCYFAVCLILPHIRNPQLHTPEGWVSIKFAYSATAFGKSAKVAGTSLLVTAVKHHDVVGIHSGGIYPQFDWHIDEKRNG